MSLSDQWLHDLEARHLADLRFAEVSRALRALSSNYVERRRGLPQGRALDGAGKRAAFALFYGPLHYLTLREIARAVGAGGRAGATVVDLGCGTGAAGVAWAEATRARTAFAIDRSPWALREAAATYRSFGVAVRTRQGDLSAVPWPRDRAIVIAAYAVNELADPARARLLDRLLERARRGDAVLVVEPLARFVAPWWRQWATAFAAEGGKSDEWRFRVELPEIVRTLDRAAGLDHRELTARSIWFAESWS